LWELVPCQAQRSQMCKTALETARRLLGGRAFLFDDELDEQIGRHCGSSYHYDAA
jgi:hypothetical protein